ncbi:thiamine diphosphokinase [Shimia aestuarii]|uniref:thiamine diphosphokinase n=1 Tax=Shimia aestuarii TaxID=254406 RepID=UPI001FB51777|nr:thiamine diphosphokinase [Shimia aestuarii]
MTVSSEIVEDLEPITLVGAGRLDLGDIALARGHAPRVVAADGGGITCLDAGIEPELIIGDMDSSAGLEGRDTGAARILRIDEQDSTDFDKALRHIRSPLVIGVGFSGARIDHELACYNALVRHAERRCLLIGGEDLVFLAPPHITLPLAAGTRVSLFPMGEVQGRSDGLRWPIEGLRFAPDGRIGTSNVADGPVVLEMTAAKMLVMVPRACLDLVVAALLETEAGWTR